MSLQDKTLAIHGGPPVRTKPWLGNLTLGPEERQAAQEVLEQGQLSLFEGAHAPEAPFSFWGGPYVQKLERAWGDYYGAHYAVSMNSGTSCLSAAIGALGIGYGDEVITSAFTMTACASSALIYGAIPIFADVRPETGCLDPVSVEEKITPRTRAILVVHQFGIPADMDSILALTKKHRLFVIEDCAQAHGAHHKGRPVGTLGSIGVFSLNVNKSIQAGEGGICITNDPELRYRLALIRNHGEAVVQAAGYHNLTNIVGFNYRMTELTAAIAIEQLKKLDRLNAARLQYTRTLSQTLSEFPFLLPPPECSHASFGSDQAGCCQSTYYLYPFRFLESVAGIERRWFVQALKAEGIPLIEGYVPPLYEQPLYQTRQAFKHGYPFSAPENRDIRTNYHAGACPVAERLHREQLLLSEFVRPPHTHDDIADMVRAFEKVANWTAEERKMAASERTSHRGPDEGI